jgi:hypothetical protein
VNMIRVCTCNFLSHNPSYLKVLHFKCSECQVESTSFSYVYSVFRKQIVKNFTPSSFFFPSWCPVEWLKIYCKLHSLNRCIFRHVKENGENNLLSSLSVLSASPHGTRRVIMNGISWVHIREFYWKLSICSDSRSNLSKIADTLLVH